MSGSTRQTSIEDPPALTGLSLASASELPAAPAKTEQNVTPWEVSGEVVDGVAKAINYDNLVDQFGTKRIDAALLARFEAVTGRKPHRWMRRGIVFSHRDLNAILDRYEKGLPFFLYTGRGPSSDSMHVGHAIPFEFTRWLQEIFDVPLVIMLTDDEKFLFKVELTIEDVKKFSRQNTRDIVALGFDPKKTFIFSDLEYMGGAFYENVVRISRCVTGSQARAIFGWKDSDNIGRIHFSSIQAAPSFATTFPHIFPPTPTLKHPLSPTTTPVLIPCAIDQDPYFRMTRDVAVRLKLPKPSLIHASFLPALQGPQSKMSASDETSAIYLSDTPAQIKKKINKYAFSGGQTTSEEQRRLGGNPQIDIAFQYLRFFLEDDAELEDIRAKYRKGELLTGELKAKCIAELQVYVKAFQERKAAVTDEVVKEFMTPRELHWKGNPNPVKPAPKEEKNKKTDAKAEKKADTTPGP